jgi:uncharacterized protein YtpQ (UPF0354 family)
MKCLNFFIISLLLVGCNSSSMTKKEFTQQYADSLSKKFPAVVFTILDDSTIDSKSNEKNIRISVDNAYSEYQSDPDSEQSILNKYISVASTLLAPAEKIDINRIVPIIKPVSYLDDMKNMAASMGYKKDFDGVYEKYNDQLIIAYAEDTKNSIRYLTHKDIKPLSIDPDSLRTIAIRNLDALLTNINGKGGNGMYMLTAGGSYEASMILLPDIFSKEKLPVTGNFVVGIPNRDIILITGSNDKEGLTKLKAAVDKSYADQMYPISDCLYKWNGKIFEKFVYIN